MREGKSVWRSLTMTASGVVIVAATAGWAASSQEQPVAPADELAALCKPGPIQALAGKLSTKVTIGPVTNLPGVADGTKFFPANGDMPAFCQVTGSYVTNPKTGKTANFLATFPENWNRKYLQLGCGGHCGTFAVSNPAMPTITITNQGTPGQIIRKGYAAFATDQGHTQMTGGTWAIKGPGEVDDDAIADYYPNFADSTPDFGILTFFGSASH